MAEVRRGPRVVERDLGQNRVVRELGVAERDPSWEFLLVSPMG